MKRKQFEVEDEGGEDLDEDSKEKAKLNLFPLFSGTSSVKFNRLTNQEIFFFTLKRHFLWKEEKRVPKNWRHKCKQSKVPVREFSMKVESV